MKRALLVIAVFGFTAAAHAGLMIEPYVGYEFGHFSGDNNSSTTESGPQFGARLGYRSIIGLGFGAEYMGTSLSMDSSPSKTATGSDVGPYVDFAFPALLKVYATLFLSSTETESGSTQGEFSGNGFKLGVGLTTLPFININFEIISRDFNKQGSGSLTSDLKDTDYALNISIPIP